MYNNAMSKELPPKDTDIFYQVMKDVTPLAQDKIRLSPREMIKKAKRPVSPSPVLSPLLVHCEDKEDVNLSVQGDQFLTYKQVSLSDKLFRKLRKGQFPIEAVLDLHGKSVMEAKNAVEGFLSQCLLHKIKIILIIHGKGSLSHKPILKNKLNNWLQHLDVVLAFSSATAAHGGQGALYVMLKSNI